MAMTPRLSDEETTLLRRQAEREGRSMHEVARLAVQERIARQEHGDRVRRAARRVATEHLDLGTLSQTLAGWARPHT